MAELLRLARAIRWAMWAFLFATVLATIYFGWHYLVDDVAGFVIGGLSVWIGALATGHQPRLRPAPAPAAA
jgi:membrane-associated phospholipid phosphatase